MGLTRGADHDLRIRLRDGEARLCGDGPPRPGEGRSAPLAARRIARPRAPARDRTGPGIYRLKRPVPTETPRSRGFLFVKPRAPARVSILWTPCADALRSSLPHARASRRPAAESESGAPPTRSSRMRQGGDRKSTRLNSSHQIISYAVF